MPKSLHKLGEVVGVNSYTGWRMTWPLEPEGVTASTRCTVSTKTSLSPTEGAVVHGPDAPSPNTQFLMDAVRSLALLSDFK